jgi:hypothetical protein
MNNFKYSHTSREREILDVVEALGSKKLKEEILKNIASKYGNEDTITVIKLALCMLGKRNAF